MPEKNPFIELFDELLEVEIEKKIMKMIILEKKPDEIIDEIIGVQDKDDKND